jgi:hypothetical protein
VPDANINKTSPGHRTDAVPESWLKERLTTTDAHELAKYELAGSGISVPDLQKLVGEGISPRWMEKWQAFIGQMAIG